MLHQCLKLLSLCIKLEEYTAVLCVDKGEECILAPWQIICLVMTGVVEGIRSILQFCYFFLRLEFECKDVGEMGAIFAPRTTTNN